MILTIRKSLIAVLCLAAVAGCSCGNPSMKPKATAPRQFWQVDWRPVKRHTPAISKGINLEPKILKAAEGTARLICESPEKNNLNLFDLYFIHLGNGMTIAYSEALQSGDDLFIPFDLERGKSIGYGYRAKEIVPGSLYAVQLNGGDGKGPNWTLVSSAGTQEMSHGIFDDWTLGAMRWFPRADGLMLLDGNRIMLTDMTASQITATIKLDNPVRLDHLSDARLSEGRLFTIENSQNSTSVVKCFDASNGKMAWRLEARHDAKQDGLSWLVFSVMYGDLWCEKYHTASFGLSEGLLTVYLMEMIEHSENRIAMWEIDARTGKVVKKTLYDKGSVHSTVVDGRRVYDKENALVITDGEGKAETASIAKLKGESMTVLERLFLANRLFVINRNNSTGKYKIQSYSLDSGKLVWELPAYSYEIYKTPRQSRLLVAFTEEDGNLSHFIDLGTGKTLTAVPFGSDDVDSFGRYNDTRYKIFYQYNLTLSGNDEETPRYLVYDFDSLKAASPSNLYGDLINDKLLMVTEKTDQYSVRLSCHDLTQGKQIWSVLLPIDNIDFNFKGMRFTDCIYKERYIFTETSIGLIVLDVSTGSSALLLADDYSIDGDSNGCKVIDDHDRLILQGKNLYSVDLESFAGLLECQQEGK